MERSTGLEQSPCTVSKQDGREAVSLRWKKADRLSLTTGQGLRPRACWGSLPSPCPSGLPMPICSLLPLTGPRPPHPPCNIPSETDRLLLNTEKRERRRLCGSSCLQKAYPHPARAFFVPLPTLHGKQVMGAPLGRQGRGHSGVLADSYVQSPNQ